MIQNCPKHVAFFLPALNSGGAEKVGLMLAGHFAGRGIKVDMILVKEEGAYLSRIPEKVRVIELGGRGMVQSIFPLMEYLKENEPDWLISGLPGPNVIGLMAKKISKTKTKVIIQQHHPFAENAAASRKIRTKLRTLLAKILFRHADHIVAVSKGVAGDLERVMGFKKGAVRVIYNPLNLGRIRGLAAEPPHHVWSRNKDKPVFIAVGRLSPPKDYETILRALANMDDARLLICGEGPDRTKIKNLIAALNLQDRVRLLGFVDNIYAEVKAADALILSSRHEGFGNALVEAMAVGTSIIASDCPYGPHEITQGGTIGHLFPVGGVEALQNSMEQALEKPMATEEDLKKYAKAYGLDAIADQYFSLFSS